ncbi:MAG: cysteine synthase A [Succinivibrio sp.]
MIYDSITDLIGKTPLLRLSGFSKVKKLSATILGKLESFNPGGSVKDRIAAAMIKDALSKGLITTKTLIIEPTSGNTGIGLALVAASLGLNLTIVMPDSMSVERRNLLRAYGAKIVLTQGSLGMEGAIRKALEIKSEHKDSFIPSQFENRLNPEAHYLTTGPEIYMEVAGELDYLVAGVGTGGTLSGAGRFLKEKIPSLKIVAVEPEGSPVLTKGVAGLHKIQGIGAGFIPDTLDQSVIDEVIDVDDTSAYETERLLAKTDGVLAGISSGAALYAAALIAKRPESQNAKIAVILPDTGERYLSTPAFLE